MPKPATNIYRLHTTANEHGAERAAHRLAPPPPGEPLVRQLFERISELEVEIAELSSRNGRLWYVATGSSVCFAAALVLLISVVVAGSR